MKMTSRALQKTTFAALVLAASRGEATMREFGTFHKCTLKVAGTPMLIRVLDALSAAHHIRTITISIDDPDILPQIKGYGTLQKKARISILKSLQSASASAGDALEKCRPPLLVTTADNALLTAKITDEFLQRAAKTQADLAVGLVSRQTIETRFPESRRTYWRFRGGAYTGCNLFALMTPNSRRVVDIWQNAETNRKKPWKIVSMFGVMNLLGFLLKIWSVDEALAHVSRHLGLTIAPVILPHAQIAIDVDKQAHLELANKILESSPNKNTAILPE